MTILVSDRKSMERGIVVRTNYAVISIRDPGTRKARVRQQSGLKAVLHLAFDDAEPAAGITLPQNIKLMTAKQAKQILVFVRKWEKRIGTIVIHCEQGVSRSPAVAAALSRYYRGDQGRFFRDYQPNSYVHRLVLNECDRAALDEDNQAAS